MPPAEVEKKCITNRTAAEPLFLAVGILLLSAAAFGGQETSMKGLAGSYSDEFGMKLNVFGDEKSGWKAKLMTISGTTKGNYYCQIEGPVLD